MYWSFTAFLTAIKPSLQAQDISRGLSCFFLCRRGDMGVCIEGEPGREVAKHAADRLDVHTVLEGDGCEGVAEVVEPDLRDAGPFQHTLQHIVDAVRGDGATVGGWEYILILRFRDITMVYSGQGSTNGSLLVTRPSKIEKPSGNSL